MVAQKKSTGNGRAKAQTKGTGKKNAGANKPVVKPRQIANPNTVYKLDGMPTGKNLAKTRFKTVPYRGKVDSEGYVPYDVYQRRYQARINNHPKRELADSNSVSKVVFPKKMTPTQARYWMARPDLYDIEGIDCPEGTRSNVVFQTPSDLAKRTYATRKAKGTEPRKPKKAQTTAKAKKSTAKASAKKTADKPVAKAKKSTPKASAKKTADKPVAKAKKSTPKAQPVQKTLDKVRVHNDGGVQVIDTPQSTIMVVAKDGVASQSRKSRPMPRQQFARSSARPVRPMNRVNRRY